MDIFILFLILFDIQNKLVFISIYNSLKAASVINPIYKSVRTSSLVENKSNFNISLCLLVNRFNNFSSLKVITSYLFFTSSQKKSLHVKFLLGHPVLVCNLQTLQHPFFSFKSCFLWTTHWLHSNPHMFSPAKFLSICSHDLSYIYAILCNLVFLFKASIISFISWFSPLYMNSVFLYIIF